MRLAKKRTLVLGLAVLLVLAALCVWAARGPGREAPRPPGMIASVNGEPVAAEEFRLLMDRFRSETLYYFQSRYSAPVTAGFWSTRFGSEAPMEHIKALALQEAVRLKVQQIWAKEYGLLEDTGFSAFREQWRKENERRKQALADGAPVYGPQQYSVDGYYDYIMSNLALRLRERLHADGLSPDAEELRQYASDHRNRQYQRADEALPDWLEEAYEKKVEEAAQAAIVIVSKEVYDGIAVQ